MGFLGFDTTTAQTGHAGKFRQYIYNIAVTISQIFSAVLGGDPDETTSSRVGKAQKAGKWWAIHLAGPVLDLFFREKDHAIKSIEPGEGAKQVWDWSA